MSYYKGTVEDQLSNLKIEGGLAESIEVKDFERIFILLLKENPDNLKNNVKKIFTRVRSKDDIIKFLFSLINILNNDLNIWKFENTIKLLFNELEDEAVDFIAQQSDKANGQKIYNNIVENQFETFFQNIRSYLEKEMSLPTLNNNFFSHVCTNLINFTKLVDIKNSDPILYPMTKFVEILLTKFICYEVMHPISMDFLMHINYRLINYLAVIPGHVVSKGLREAINIYDIVRKGVVNMTFSQPEVICNALSILEHRSRFFGLNADAIPENENHGDYIVIDPLNAPFEDDDVYDDYEKFLATLPN